MPSAFYVWQRNWDEPVREAIRTAPEAVLGLAPLCAEVGWDAEGRATVAWPKLDLAALRQSGRPVSAVVRIGPCKPSDAAQAEIRKVASEVLALLRAGQVEPTELQIDFDCAEAQLAGYRQWLAALRVAVAPLPVRPTVLPSWLGRAEFAGLARDCDGYILQVHATARPRIDAPETALCEAADARRWVEQAGRIGVPFRVALPTYTYRVAFAPEGKLLGIEAEGTPRMWPTGTVLRAFRPDAAEVAGLVQAWTQDRPACLAGLLWYRLPVATDELNWRWPTLTAVLAGRAPRAKLRIEQTGAEPADLTLVNVGETEASYAAQLVAKCARPIEDADAVGCFRVSLGENAAVFRPAAELRAARLPPGARVPVGWVRAGAKIEIEPP